MTNQNFWLWFAAHAWALAILGATMLEALFIWAYRGDREEPWSPNCATEDLAGSGLCVSGGVPENRGSLR